jgi:carboxypeptidase family protein
MRGRADSFDQCRAGDAPGVVKDSSGAVLPGVTVETSSSALIEKTRTATTDGTGQYQIVDLRPGTYGITFSLSGFRSVTREGVEISGAGVITINADLSVGPLNISLHKARSTSFRQDGCTASGSIRST